MVQYQLLSCPLPCHPPPPPWLWKRWWPIIDCVLTLQNQCRYVSKKLFVCYHFLLYNFLIFPMWSSLTCLKVHFLLFQQERSPVFRPHSFLSTWKDRVVPNIMCLVVKEVNHGNNFPFYPFALLFPSSNQPVAISISTFFAPDFWFPFILVLIIFSVVRSHRLEYEDRSIWMFGIDHVVTAKSGRCFVTKCYRLIRSAIIEIHLIGALLHLTNRARFAVVCSDIRTPCPILFI